MALLPVKSEQNSKQDGCQHVRLCVPRRYAIRFARRFKEVFDESGRKARPPIAFRRCNQCVSALFAPTACRDHANVRWRGEGQSGDPTSSQIGFDREATSRVRRSYPGRVSWTRVANAGSQLCIFIVGTPIAKLPVPMRSAPQIEARHAAGVEPRGLRSCAGPSRTPLISATLPSRPTARTSARRMTGRDPWPATWRAVGTQGYAQHTRQS